MAIIGLIRHGVTEWNVVKRAQGISNIPLSDEGKKQAAALAARLSEDEQWDFIVTSDLSRAVETAQIIAAKLTIPILTHEKRIREIDCGEIEGTTEEERIQKWGVNWHQLELGGETFTEVAVRGSKFLEEIAAANQGARILIVSHGALISLAVQRLLPQTCPLTFIGNTALSILEYRQGEWECKRYNCVRHLN